MAAERFEREGERRYGNWLYWLQVVAVVVTLAGRSCARALLHLRQRVPAVQTGLEET